MSHIIPYISTEPPSLHDDSFEKESSSSEISDYNTHKITSPIKKDEIEIQDIIENDQSIDLNNIHVDSQSSVETNVQNIDSNIDLSLHFNNNDLNYINDIESRTPLEIRQHIEKVMKDNNLSLDCTDGVIKSNVDEDDDVLSECSFDGQFDEYIDKINNKLPLKVEEKMECNSFDTESNPYLHNPFVESKNIDLNTDYNFNGDMDCDFGDFGVFENNSKDEISYFVEKNDQPFSKPFGNVYGCYSDIDETDSHTFVNKNQVKEEEDQNKDHCKDEEKNKYKEDREDIKYKEEVKEEVKYKEDEEENNCKEHEEENNCKDKEDDDFDDFDDFASFERHDSTEIVLKEPVKLNSPDLQKDLQEDNINDVIDLFRQKLLASVNLIDISSMPCSTDVTNSSLISSQSFISNHSLINDYGVQIWKELTNFDYSPAFIFHWMQTSSYDNFMNSIGPDYKELLSSQRATLPLYSVNLTPIEPVHIDNLNQNIHSTSSSSLDLSVYEKPGNNIQEKSSNFDIKNLEDEFIFNTTINDDVNISNPNTDNRSSLPNLSSAVIQSEGLGGILKSMLKPLNQGKSSSTASKSLNPQTEVILKDLPDLSYMTSKVLMFPVLASCDVEDNI